MTSPSCFFIIIDLAFDKGKGLLEASCSFSDFGTRRRRSFHTQDLVVQGLVQAFEENSNTGGRFNGTSNVNSSDHSFYFISSMVVFRFTSHTSITLPQ